jgi:hypothetical protein
MMYNDHDRSRSQIPAEPLFLANNTDPRRATSSCYQNSGGSPEPLGNSMRVRSATRRGQVFRYEVTFRCNTEAQNSPHGHPWMTNLK